MTRYTPPKTEEEKQAEVEAEFDRLRKESVEKMPDLTNKEITHDLSLGLAQIAEIQQALEAVVFPGLQILKQLDERISALEQAQQKGEKIWTP